MQADVVPEKGFNDYPPPLKESYFITGRFLPPGVELQEHNFAELKQASKAGRIFIKKGIPYLRACPDSTEKEIKQLALVRKILALIHKSQLAERIKGIPSLRITTEENLKLILGKDSVSAIVIDHRWGKDRAETVLKKQIEDHYVVVGWLQVYTNAETFPLEEKIILPEAYKNNPDIMIVNRLMTINFVTPVTEDITLKRYDSLLKDYGKGLIVDALFTALGSIAEREGKEVLGQVRSKPENVDGIAAYLPRGFSEIPGAMPTNQYDNGLWGEKIETEYYWWLFSSKVANEAMRGERLIDKKPTSNNRALSPITTFLPGKEGKIVFLCNSTDRMRELSWRVSDHHKVIGVLPRGFDQPRQIHMQRAKKLEIISIKNFDDYLSRRTIIPRKAELDELLNQGTRLSRESKKLFKFYSNTYRRVQRLFNSQNQFSQVERYQGRENSTAYPEPDLSMLSSDRYFNSEQDLKIVGKLAKRLQIGGTIVFQELCLPPIDPNPRANFYLTLSAEKTVDFKSFLNKLEIEEKNNAGQFGYQGSKGETKWQVTHALLTKFSLFLTKNDHHTESDSPHQAHEINWKKPLTRDLLISKLRDEGLRVISAVPLLPKPEILDGIYIENTSNNRVKLSLPSSHWCIVAEKVAPGQGVEMRKEKFEACRDPKSIKIVPYIVETKKGPEVHEVCYRPEYNIVSAVMVFPDQRNKAVSSFSLIGRHYQRITRLVQASQWRYSQQFDSGYTIEPITFKVEKGLSEEEVKGIVIVELEKRLGIDITKLNPDISIYRGFIEPGSFDERNYTAIIKINEWVHGELEEKVNSADLATFGKVYPISLESILCGGELGVVNNFEIQLACYRFCLLMEEVGGQIEPWLGAPILLARQEIPHKLLQNFKKNIQHSKLAEKETIKVHDRRNGYYEFQRIIASERTSVIDSKTEDKTILAKSKRAFISHSKGTELGEDRVAILPVISGPDGEVYIGVLELSSPAAFNAFGKEIEFPQLRSLGIPLRFTTQDSIHLYTKERLEEEGVIVKNITPIGGGYPFSIGMSPGAMQPVVAEVDLKKSPKAPYVWYSLRHVIEEVPHLLDANLALLACRLYRATQKSWVKHPKLNALDL